MLMIPLSLLREKTKKAVQYIANFEYAVAREAAQWDINGIICEYIDHAELRFMGDVWYVPARGAAGRLYGLCGAC